VRVLVADFMMIRFLPYLVYLPYLINCHCWVAAATASTTDWQAMHLMHSSEMWQCTSECVSYVRRAT
jgi:hypothetical protein